MGRLSTHTRFHLLSMKSKRDPDSDHFHLILGTNLNVQQVHEVLVIKSVQWAAILKLALLQRWKAYQNKTIEMHSLDIQRSREQFCSTKTTSA